MLVELREAGQVKLELAVELGLARIHVAQRDGEAALIRLHRVVRLAQAKAFHTHPVVAASIYGELLAAQGQTLYYRWTDSFNQPLANRRVGIFPTPTNSANIFSTPHKLIVKSCNNSITSLFKSDFLIFFRKVAQNFKNESR